MNICDMCRLPFFGLAVLVIVAGCARQKVESPELLAASARQEQKSVDFGSLTSLTAAEKKAYADTAKLDRNLTPAMESQVRYHFVKYSRERRSTMENFLRNSIPYLNYTKSVFRSRGLPEDLAYLAYLESGYNPLAVSTSNAVGMWQFISSTGRAYGLRQDWWTDERRDPYRSTEAAAQYLSRLYEIFHDWHLAVASYNGGEGKIGRAKEACGADKLHEIIQKNDSLDYKLQLREETRLYVPRFLAISKVMRNAEVLGLKPAVPDSEHPVLVPVATLSARPATDLVELCRRLGMTWKEFLAYNPHFLRSISPAGRTSAVYVPRNKEALARRLLAGNLSGAGWTYYTVRRKDTLAKVSSKTGVPASVIRQLNPGTLKSGKRLRLPTRSGAVAPGIPMPVPDTAVASATSRKPQAGKGDHASSALAELKTTKGQGVKGGTRSSVPASYTVKGGDTLTSIARRYDMELGEIYAANGGENSLGTLRVGQVIRLSAPARAVAQAPAAKQGNRKAAAAGEASRPAVHTVQPGETGYAIARRYNISFGELCAVNGGTEALSRLSPGQRLKLPVAGTAVAVKNAASKDEETRGRKKSRQATGAAEEYCVQTGETLWSISRKFNMKPMELLALNGMDQSTRVKVGDTVKVIRNSAL